MATLDIVLPDSRHVSVSVPDGAQRIQILLHECACGCGLWYQPHMSGQKFYDEEHQIEFNSLRRPRKTHRSIKTRKSA